MNRKIIFIMNDFSLMGGVEKTTSHLISSFQKFNIPIWGIWSFNQLNEKSKITYPNNINFIVSNDLSFFEKELVRIGITDIIFHIGSIVKANQIIPIAIRKNINFISVIHSSPYFWLSGFYNKNIVSLFRCVRMSLGVRNRNFLYLRNILEQSTYSFFVSKGAKKEAEKLFLLDSSVSQKINYIYNIVPELCLKNNQYTDSQIIQLKENIIVYAGRLHDIKRVFETVKVLTPLLKNNLNWKYYIIGSGREKNKIKKYIKINKLDDSIKLISDVNNVEDYLMKSKICVLYSLYEGLPTILLEAIRYKNIIISYPSKGGVSDILIDGENGFWAHNNEDLYAKIKQFIDNDQLYLDFVKNDKNLYKDFSEISIINRWKKILGL